MHHMIDPTPEPLIRRPSITPLDMRNRRPRERRRPSHIALSKPPRLAMRRKQSTKMTTTLCNFIRTHNNPIR